MRGVRLAGNALRGTQRAPVETMTGSMESNLAEVENDAILNAACPFRTNSYFLASPWSGLEVSGQDTCKLEGRSEIPDLTARILQ